jgi:acyl-CoA synthetase (AMP-forming)/AMP-acid ligase II
MTDQQSTTAPRRISDFLAHAARRSPDREAAVFGDDRISYAMLERQVERYARGLVAAGVARGDRVAMLSTPRPEFLTVFLATLRVGAIWVGLNPVHKLDEYRYVLRDCRPSLLFGFAHLRDRDNREVLRRLKTEISSIGQVVLFDRAHGIGATHDEFAAMAERVADDAYAAAVAAVRPDDVAMIVHTSGSTGQAKGAMITHRNLAHCAAVQLELFPVAPLRILCNLPINHTVCTCDVVSYALAAGGTVIFQERFDPAAVLAAIANQRVTCLLQISAMLQRILAHARRVRFDTSSLQAVFFLGSPMPRDMIVELKTLGGEVITGWGLTEATASVTYTARGDDIDVLADTVGRSAPTFEIRIADPEGRLVAAGDAGEVLVRGPCVMAGYFGRPEATAAAIDAEGWLHSGDLGRIDGDGRLRLVGRIKEMFKSGGYNVYPREVEAVLESHPAVALAVVVSVPDPLYHEAGHAFLIREPDRSLAEAEIGEYCRARLANYKVPKRFTVRDALPMLSVGKIDRVALRKEALEQAAFRAG